MILKSIYLDKFFIFFILIIVLTGNFNYFIAYFLLLFIHELGHAIMGIILGFQFKKIVFYPLGGVTIFNFPFNISLYKELLILISGPIFQIIGYLILRNYFPFIKIYHYTLLIFNLLPIYPLDGGKIFNIICSCFYNYLFSLNITFIISIIIIVILFIYNMYYFNLNLLFMIILIITKLYKTYKNRYIYYNRFLLERYLNHYTFNKIKNINNIKEFYRDRYHYVNFIKEEKILKKHFEK